MLSAAVFLVIGTVLAGNIADFSRREWRPWRSYPGRTDFTDVANQHLTPHGREIFMRCVGLALTAFGGYAIAAWMLGDRSGSIHPLEPVGLGAGLAYGGLLWLGSSLLGIHGTARIIVRGGVVKNFTTKSVQSKWVLDPVNRLRVLAFDIPGRGTLSIWMSNPSPGSYDCASSLSHAEFAFDDYACNSTSGSITIDKPDGLEGHVEGTYADVNQPQITGEWSAVWRLRG